MVGERRAPCMEHGSDPDAGAEMLRVGGDRQYRLGCRAKQQIVDRRLILRGDVGDLGRQGEDDMEVSDRQQVGLALGEPGARGGSLALWAVPVAAAIIGNPRVPAVLAGLDMAAKRSGAAM